MERSKYIYIVLLSIIFWSFTYKSTYREIIYDAYVKNNMNLWKHVIQHIESFNPKNDVEILEVLNYQYGYIAWCIGNKKYNEARDMLTKAYKNLDKLSNLKNESMIYAYKGAFLGYEIGIDKFKAPFIGNQSLKLLNQAINKDKNNFFAYLQKANALFYAPSFTGGSKEKAIELYLKSLQLYLYKYDGKYDWNYINLLMSIVNAYFETQQFDKAKYYAEKILAIEPNFTWVKNDIYPKIIENIKK